MLAELEAIAGQCDGVRCDMAMLVLPEVFARTWGVAAADPFWPSRRRNLIHRRHPGLPLHRGGYWDLEWALQQQGFDFTYDKRLYDRLRAGRRVPCAQHLRADSAIRTAPRFLENHDEPRAAAIFPPGIHRAAAVLTFLSPGLRFFHQGEREGKRVRIPMHLAAGRPSRWTRRSARSTTASSRA